jgi:hypothetical protein
MPVESTQQLKGTLSGIPFSVNLHFTLTARPQ